MKKKEGSQVQIDQVMLPILKSLNKSFVTPEEGLNQIENTLSYEGPRSPSVLKLSTSEAGSIKQFYELSKGNSL